MLRSQTHSLNRPGRLNSRHSLKKTGTGTNEMQLSSLPSSQRSHLAAKMPAFPVSDDMTVHQVRSEKRISLRSHPLPALSTSRWITKRTLITILLYVPRPLPGGIRTFTVGDKLTLLTRFSDLQCRQRNRMLRPGVQRLLRLRALSLLVLVIMIRPSEKATSLRLHFPNLIGPSTVFIGPYPASTTYYVPRAHQISIITVWERIVYTRCFIL